MNALTEVHIMAPMWNIKNLFLLVMFLKYERVYLKKIGKARKV